MWKRENSVAEHVTGDEIVANPLTKVLPRDELMVALQTLQRSGAASM